LATNKQQNKSVVTNDGLLKTTKSIDSRPSWSIGLSCRAAELYCILPSVR